MTLAFVFSHSSIVKLSGEISGIFISYSIAEIIFFLLWANCFITIRNYRKRALIYDSMLSKRL